MRILHVCLDYPPRRTRYGSGTVNDDLLAALDRAGHEVAVLTPGRADRATDVSATGGLQLVEAPTELTVRHLLPPGRPGEMFATPGDVEAWNAATVGWLADGWPLGRWRVDVVHNDGWTTQSVANALGARFGCPVVTTAHVVDRHYSALSGWRARPDDAVFQAAEERCFGTSDIVVVPSATARDLAAHYFPGYSDKLRVVPHRLDWHAIDRFTGGAGAAPDARTVTVHYLGRISSERGWRPFLDAFVAAAELEHRLRLRVVGDGARLADAMSRYQHPAISFLGALPRPLVVDELRRGDIFCNPALVETFGVAELEAMGLGLCVISNTGFGKHTHVDHLATGVTVPILQHAGLAALDEAAWSSRLVEIAADSTLRDLLGTAARSVARSHYHVDRMAADLLAVFQEAISRRIPRHATTRTEKVPT